MRVVNIHDDMQPTRATGKTFRILTSAMLLASSGEHVHIVAKDMKAVRWTIGRLYKMLNSFLLIDDSGAKNFIEFPSRGFIKVVPNSYKDREFKEMVMIPKHRKFKVLWDLPAIFERG